CHYPSSPLYSVFLLPATSQLSSLSLHDALPICSARVLDGGPITITMPPRRFWLSTHKVWSVLQRGRAMFRALVSLARTLDTNGRDRKSTRLNSSHVAISYAVFCLKKKNKKNTIT